MYLFRRISHEKNLTKKDSGIVRLYQTLNPDLNYLIGCAKSNVSSHDDNLPNWHVHVKEPDQKYNPGCVFQAEGMTQFMRGVGPYDEKLYECKTKVYIFNVDYIPPEMVKSINEKDISTIPCYRFGKHPDEIYAETNGLIGLPKR